MKNKGFTLIELLCAIGIMAMLATILVPVAIKKVNSAKEKSYETLIKSIELAAETYVIEKDEELTLYNQNDYIYVTIETLIENNYFDKSLINQKTNEAIPISDEVYVTRDYKGKIKSTYDIDQNEKPKIILIGTFNTYIKIGDTYIDLGATATDDYDGDVTSNVVVSGNVDSTTVGEYTITYSVSNSTENTTTKTRNVIVYDD